MATPYVNARSATLVTSIEKKLESFSKEAGIIFISVTARPEEGGDCDFFAVRLGLIKSLSIAAGDAIVKTALKDEIARGISFHVSVYLGIPGASYDKGDAGVGTTPA